MIVIKGGSSGPSSPASASKSGGGSSSPPEEKPKIKPPRRERTNWLLKYGEYTKELEAPETYHLWTGLSVLASALRRNVWIEQNHYQVFPHMYVILTGPPGKLGKSTTIRAGRRILLGVEGINMGADAVTMEEMIRQLGNLTKKTGRSEMTIHSSELSSLIDPSGIKMIGFLTDIYDGDALWKYATKQSGKDTIRNPVVNILAGTTPAWIANEMPGSATETGFTARTIFVFEDEPRHLRPFLPPLDSDLVAELIDELNHISMLEGEFEWGPGSRDAYEEAYAQIYREQPSDYRIESYHWRKRTHILKVAMLLAVARSDDMVVLDTDIRAAGNLLKEIEKKMPQTFSAVGRNENASDLERIYARIKGAGKSGIKPSEIYREFYAMGGQMEIDNILNMLSAMKYITKVGEGGTIIYRAQFQ